MNWYEIGWVVWILAFVALEVKALRDVGKDDTLSEFVWKITKPWPLRFVLGGFLLWLLLHLVGVPV